MPALDRFFHAAKAALIKDGWTITDEPLTLRYEGREAFVDIGAERDVIGAEKGTRKIAVEIKTFAGRSDLADMHIAVGQFIVYKTMLSQLEPEREVYLAVTEAVYTDVFTRDVGALMLENVIDRLFTFDPKREEIVRWLP